MRFRSPNIYRALFCAIALWLIALVPATGEPAGTVVADHELATRAGMETLRRGGNAIDAAVATAFALGVVDPAASGIGGGGFMVIYRAKEKKAHALDFREVAPALAERDLYMKSGQPVPALSLAGPLAVAVPGAVAGLAEALKRFGTLPLGQVMAPAITYASTGVPVSRALRNAFERQRAEIGEASDLGQLFLKDSELPGEGETIRQPDLSTALKAIADQGPQVFYEGWIAQAIVERIKKGSGVLSPADLKGYKPVWREPLIGSYRGRTVITMPPPSSGGTALIQMLNVLEGYQLGSIAHNSATYLHLLAETMKHAFADRAQYLGDPDFVRVPLEKLTSKDYAAWVRGRISSVRTQAPRFYGLSAYRAGRGGTTHFSVVDDDGNAVACTLTINTQFGAKVVAPRTGIILNNEMDDFTIHPGAPNVYGLVGAEANALKPRKRPISSMSPTIVLQGDRPALVVGAAGGPRIISATLQTILNALDFRMPVKRAVETPRIHHQWLPNEIAVEPGIAPQTRKSLERRGHVVKEKHSLGVAQAIHVTSAKTAGAVDPRKGELPPEDKVRR